MAWELTLVLAAVVGGGWLVQACPDHCSCRHEQGLYVANCSSLPSFSGKIEALTLLPHHSPLELVDGQFNFARHLKYLSLRNCSVYFIRKKAFYGAKNVIEVDLSYNRIEEIEPTVFQHLSSLTTLILRGNPIQFLSEVPFLISNSLQHLDMGDCKIKHVPRGVFYGLKRLKYLSLDKNLLKSIKYNSLPKGLKYIDISNNLIVNVPTEVLSSLTNLRRLGLGGNPINCSCSLLNLQDWLSGRGVIFEDDVICALPTHYKGVSWSKVDENTLCLAEARREEIYHSIYNPLLKNRLYKENYFENENSYQGENLQSDQPQPYPDSEAEVLFQNDDTLAMGEMMRDEDGSTGLSEVKKDVEEETIVDPTERKVEPLESEEKIILESHISDTTNMTSIEKKENPINLDIKEDVTTADTVSLNEVKPVEFKTLSEDDTNTEKDVLQIEGLMHAGSSSSVETNSTEEGSTVLPDFEETTEEEVISTDETPIFASSMSEDEIDQGSQNVSSSTETNDEMTLKPSEIPQVEVEGTIPHTSAIPDLNSENESETNTSGVIVPNLGSEATTNHGTNDDKGLRHKSAIPIPGSIEEAKIKPVAGAEVVMFCVAVLIVCLILYSVYRCRNKKKQNTRIIKEKPSNRDTEMQDMASLLPKPQDDNGRINSKYPDKVPSSETEKLISNDTEKAVPVVTPVSETKGKIEDKNSLNNNTPDVSTSPTSKTPLIQPGNPVTINTAAPIQRTKAKVGIIPDSIPRTPIFLQKTFNGTKHV